MMIRPVFQLEVTKILPQIGNVQMCPINEIL